MDFPITKINEYDSISNNRNKTVEIINITQRITNNFEEKLYGL